MSQILLIYCLWADCWYSARASGLPGILGSLHMHYSTDLGMSTGKLDVQKWQTRVRNPPASSDRISRQNKASLGKSVRMATIPLSLSNSNLHQGVLMIGNTICGQVFERETTHCFEEKLDLCAFVCYKNDLSHAKFCQKCFLFCLQTA